MNFKIILTTIILLSIAITGCELNQKETTNNPPTQINAEHEEEYSIDISGQDMKTLTITQIAELWDINPEELLNEIIKKFELKKEYTTNTPLETLREEYKFSPSLIKDIAEELKTK